MTLKSLEKRLEAKVLKVDNSLGLVLGFAIICKQAGEDYFDRQDEHIPEDAMLHAATDFMKNSRVAKEMHKGEQVGGIVFAWPLTEDIAKAMGITSYEKSGLMIGMAPDSEAMLEKFRNGTLTGFSIGGAYIDTEEVNSDG